MYQTIWRILIPYNKVLMPSGTYYVGDPCYVFSDNEWDKFINIIDTDECHRIHGFSGKAYAVSTAYGDGQYSEKEDLMCSVSVDAGCIGVVDIQLLSKIHREEYSNNIMIFDNDFYVFMDKEDNYTINIGHLKFTTGDVDEDYCEVCDEHEDDCVCEECPECFEIYDPRYSECCGADGED